MNVVRLLATHGANIHAGTCPPLIYCQSAQMLRTLLSLGANPRFNFGNRSLMSCYVHFRDSIDLIRVLLLQGVSPIDAGDPPNSETPLWRAKNRQKECIVEEMERYLEDPARYCEYKDQNENKKKKKLVSKEKNKYDSDMNMNKDTKQNQIQKEKKTRKSTSNRTARKKN